MAKTYLSNSLKRHECRLKKLKDEEPQNSDPRNMIVRKAASTLHSHAKKHIKDAMLKNEGKHTINP
jgi:hypothetical protein